MLEGTNAVVTGGAGGLGSAVVEAFLARGARVTATDARMEYLDKLKSNLSGYGSALSVIAADVSTDEGAASIVAAAEHDGQGLDILVHTVGGFAMGPLAHETDRHLLDHMLSLNVGTAITTLRHAGPKIRASKRGRFVAIGAKPALAGMAQMGAYSLAKAAVLRLVETFAAEITVRGATANAVLPSIIDTPRNREAMPDADFESWVPPARLAAIIAFLCSNDAQDINGAAIPVYGGMA